MKIYAIKINDLNRIIIPDDAENVLVSTSKEFEDDFGFGLRDTFPDLYERIKEFKNNYIDPFDRKLYVEAYGHYHLKGDDANKTMEYYMEFLESYEVSYDSRNYKLKRRKFSSFE